MSQATSAPDRSTSASGRLLDIDATKFAASFNRKPFLIRHQLGSHPLFALPRLIELSQALDPATVEYNAGQIPVSMDPRQTPRTGLGIEETIRRIEDCSSWMVLKFVERDPAYRDLLLQCLEEVKVYSKASHPDMRLPQGFIFISSAGSVTPYHMDPEHNFLLQIRGDKTMSVFDGGDRTVLSEEELEQFYGGAHRNMVFKDEYQAKAFSFQLKPGDGLHVPVTFPHHVRVGSTYSISFSITFRTPDLDRRALIYDLNGKLRRRGYRPVPFGRSALRDTVKFQAARVLRKVQRTPAPSHDH